MSSPPEPRTVRGVGNHALLVECRPGEAAELAVMIKEQSWRQLDVVPAARTVLVDGLDPAEVSAVAAQLAVLPLAGRPASQVHQITIPMRYDGPDLLRVSQSWQMSLEETIATHQRLEFVVDFCGFSPGFAYCSGLPPELRVPRLATPRAHVAAGAVALADRYCAVYPRASPGGWQVLGHTDLSVWDPVSPTPALLAPGTRVRFTHV